MKYCPSPWKTPQLLPHRSATQKFPTLDRSFGFGLDKSCAIKPILTGEASSMTRRPLCQQQTINSLQTSFILPICNFEIPSKKKTINHTTAHWATGPHDPLICQISRPITYQQQPEFSPPRAWFAAGDWSPGSLMSAEKTLKLSWNGRILKDYGISSKNDLKKKSQPRMAGPIFWCLILLTLQVFFWETVHSSWLQFHECQSKPTSLSKVVHRSSWFGTLETHRNSTDCMVESGPKSPVISNEGWNNSTYFERKQPQWNPFDLGYL